MIITNFLIPFLFLAGDEAPVREEIIRTGWERYQRIMGKRYDADLFNAEMRALQRMGIIICLKENENKLYSLCTDVIKTVRKQMNKKVLMSKNYRVTLFIARTTNWGREENE